MRKMTIFTTDATRVSREVGDGSRGSCWRCRRGGARSRPSIFFRYILLSTTNRKGVDVVKVVLELVFYVE